MFTLFPGKVNEDYFGGRLPFYTSLMQIGLLCDCCNWCPSKELSLYWLEGENLPRARCLKCKKRCASLREGTIFNAHGINDIPGFIFVANCFALNVPFQAVVVLSGLDQQTVRSYQGYVSEMINKIVEKKNLGMEHSLGAEGKSSRSMKFSSPNKCTGLDAFRQRHR